MAPRPKVSIIIPAYNRARWLRHSVLSVLAQSDPDLEVVVIDDGSDDDLEATLAQLLRQDPRLRYHRQPNQGPGAARNRGIELARGRYLGFLDSDDLMAPRWVEQQSRHLARHDCDIAVCQNLFFHESAGGARSFFDNPRRIETDRPVRGLMFGNFIPICNALVPRALLEKRRFDETLRKDEDWHLWAHLALDGVRFGSHRESLVAVRLHPDQRSGGGRQIPESRLRILDDLEARWRSGRTHPFLPSMRDDCLAIIELRRMAQHITLEAIGPALVHLWRGLVLSPVGFVAALCQKALAFLTRSHQVRARVYGRTPFFQRGQEGHQS